MQHVQPVGATLCVRAWARFPLDVAVPPLEVGASPGQWTAAFRARDAICDLLKGSFPPLMQYVGGPLGWAQVISLVDRVLEQARKQKMKLNGDGVPIGEDRKKNCVGTFIGESKPHRPFGTLMSRDDVNTMFRSYIKSVAQKMIFASPSPEWADRTVYICARDWDHLDPLRRAEGVLAAMTYYEQMQTAAILQAQRAAAAAPVLLSEGHRYAPSLTDRQARRSAVTECELRKRWD